METRYFGDFFDRPAHQRLHLSTGAGPSKTPARPHPRFTGFRPTPQSATAKTHPHLPPRVQIVGYDTARPEPDQTARPAAIHVATDDAVDTIALTAGTELAYTLHDRHCAGHVDRSDHRAITGHQPCPNPDAPYCPEHTSTWACARCTGNCTRPLDTCREEHAIYLAAFAPDIFKVGVTRSWRLQTRLREQGADRGAHINTVPDGRIARQLEAEIAETLTDRVRTPTKRRSIATAVDDDAWNALLAEHEALDRYTYDYGLDVDTQPVAETLATGTVHGVKGRLLVIDHNDTTYATDLRDLVGHDVTPEPASRDVQSSLTSF
jgi:hypothetical protein